jgi:hypothetical protein
MQTERAPLPFSQALSFVNAIRDNDCFTVFWELAEYSPEPVPFEKIRKTFGAHPVYLLKILDRLHRLGIARKAGRQWTVTGWAKSNLEYLEIIMKDFKVEVAEAVSPFMGVYASNATEVATLNGFWSASTTQVTAQDSSGSTAPLTASADQAAKLASADFDNMPHEARSHDYK